MARSYPQDYDYLRRNYGLNLGKGMRVRIRADASSPEYALREGVVLGASSHVSIKLDDGFVGTWHPKDVEALP